MNYNELIEKCKKTKTGYTTGINTRFGREIRMIGVCIREHVLYWFEELGSEKDGTSWMSFYKSHSYKNGVEKFSNNSVASRTANKFLEA